MSDRIDPKSREEISDIAIDVAIRVGLLSLLAFLCIFVVAPFITILLWGVILAITLYPVWEWMAARLGAHRARWPDGHPRPGERAGRQAGG